MMIRFPSRGHPARGPALERSRVRA